MLIVAVGAGAQGWSEVAPGVEAARFDVGEMRAAEDGDLVVVRVDPREARLTVLTAQTVGDDEDRSARRWAEDFGLLVVANSGMYQADRRTHVGFMQVDGEVLNRFANDYLSAAAFDPVDPETDPPFRIFDLDETPLSEVKARYRTVVQNLRLIKRGRENRWEPTGDSWREVALGEDASGRLLLMSCDARLTMHRFNEIVLRLPLGLQCAQHLEGRYQAHLWLDDPDFATGFSAVGGPVLPNVLGVRAPVSGTGP